MRFIIHFQHRNTGKTLSIVTPEHRGDGKKKHTFQHFASKGGVALFNEIMQIGDFL